MKEEDEYLDTIISSAMNSLDVDVSMLNNDWDDLKPLLVKRKKKRKPNSQKKKLKRKRKVENQKQWKGQMKV